MLFNSLQFLVFFPTVVLFYYSVPHKYRWVLLLAASYYFYACWRVEYLSLIIISTLIDYYAGIKIGKSTNKIRRKMFLFLSLFTNLGLLFAFKYFNFFNESIFIISEKFNVIYSVPDLNVLLPVGISFYTFQTLSYTIDVYRGDRDAEHHLGIFAVYVSFFPQLVAGPIERSSTLMPQFYKAQIFDRNRLFDGLRQMLWGFFKKIVIADRLAYYVDMIYNNPYDYSGGLLFVATLFFAFQIYCDFSGYSDIAIGAAKVMGINLMTNFRQPYFSLSIREFWSRWHISLSSWFRDYVYISLGGNRVVKIYWFRNLLITFVVSGLWHGANWTFLIWGTLHGIYLVFSIISDKFRASVRNFIRLPVFPPVDIFWKTMVTFCLVLFAWIFFRANSVTDSFYIIGEIFSYFSDISFISVFWSDTLKILTANELMYILSIIFILNIYDFGIANNSKIFNNKIFISFDTAFQFWMIIFFGVFNNVQFIYFQF